MIGYIYKTTCLVNGKIYIGQHQGKKLDINYFGSGKAILLAIKRYGKINFEVEILYRANSNEKLNEKEIYYIKRFKLTCRIFRKKQSY